MATNFGKTGKFWSDGDFNFDGTVNTSHFTALAGNFGATPLSDLPVLGTLVPEPAMFALLFTLGMIGLVPRRMRPKCRAA